MKFSDIVKNIDLHNEALNIVHDQDIISEIKFKIYNEYFWADVQGWYHGGLYIREVNNVRLYPNTSYLIKLEKLLKNINEDVLIIVCPFLSELFKCAKLSTTDVNKFSSNNSKNYSKIKKTSDLIAGTGNLHWVVSAENHENFINFINKMNTICGEEYDPENFGNYFSNAFGNPSNDNELKYFFRKKYKNMGHIYVVKMDSI